MKELGKAAGKKAVQKIGDCYKNIVNEAKEIAKSINSQNEDDE